MLVDYESFIYLVDYMNDDDKHIDRIFLVARKVEFEIIEWNVSCMEIFKEFWILDFWSDFDPQE